MRRFIAMAVFFACLGTGYLSAAAPSSSEVAAPAHPNEPSDVAEALADQASGDAVHAFTLMSAAAERGNPRGQYYLGAFYKFGVGTKLDLASAAVWFSKAAAQGDAEAETDLGMLKLTGQGVAADPKVGMALLEKAAPNLPMAASALCVIYSGVLGGQSNDTRALGWCRKSAAAGQAPAEYVMGLGYDYGLLGLEKDPQQGLSWTLSSAKQGFAPAESHMGERLSAGLGGPVDDRGAVDWYKAAAAQNFGQAEFRLAEAYERGLGVPSDQALALAFYEKAAARDVVPAQIWLAAAYQHGIGGAAVDRAKSMNLWVAAAKSADVVAERQAGLALAAAPEAQRDDIQALVWLKLADAQAPLVPRDANESAIRASLKARLSCDQVYQAEMRFSQLNRH